MSRFQQFYHIRYNIPALRYERWSRHITCGSGSSVNLRPPMTQDPRPKKRRETKTRTNQEMKQRTCTFTQCARKLPEFAEITQNNGHYAVQGHSRSPMLIYDFLLVINTNLPPILHRFRDISVDRSEIAIGLLGYHSCV